ncbi:hypothetical protein ACFVTY_04750 [Streptomyces sp. NPDC058067]
MSETPSQRPDFFARHQDLIEQILTVTRRLGLDPDRVDADTMPVERA